MGERLMEKLARLGAEAGIKQMTPEIYKFSMLVRADTVEQWPQREWVGLTELEKAEITSLKWWDWEDTIDIDGFIQAIEAKLKEKNT